MGFWDKLWPKPEAQPFDADRDIAIELFVGGMRVAKPTANETHLRVVTRGLGKHKLPELELVEIPTPMLDGAVKLLRLVANYSVGRRQLTGDGPFAVRVPQGFVLAAELHVVPTSGERVLRLVDLGQSLDAPAKTILTAMIVSDAHAPEEGDSKASDS